MQARLFLAAALAAAVLVSTPASAYDPLAPALANDPLAAAFADDPRAAVRLAAPGRRVLPPIAFRPNSAEMTRAGKGIAAEWLAYLKDQAPTRVTITGHTDHRGRDDHNLTLSTRRAKAVAAYLAAGGLAASFDVVGRGETEPRDLVDPSVYTPDEIGLLNRRVEVSWEPSNSLCGTRCGIR